MQDLDFPDQFANAPVGVIELAGNRIVLALLQTGIHPGQSPIPPLFELLDWHGDFLRDRIDRLAAQQTQDHSFFRAADQRLTTAGVPASPAFFSFSFSGSLSQTRFYPKCVSR